MATSPTRSEPGSSLFSGRYLLHFHTVATDGKLTVAEYFQYAREQGLDRLIWLEHIRRQPTYDVAALVVEVRRRSEETGIAATLGFEAKVLPDGGLDLSEEHLVLADVIGLAEHGFKGSAEDLEHAISTAFERYRGFRQRGVMIWVHPGLWLRKNRTLEIEQERYLRLLRLAQDCGVRLERNSRYGLLSDEFLGFVRPESVVIGADAHSREELARHEARCRTDTH